MRYDYLIVGSGLFGSVLAWRIRKLGKTCLVIDRRGHVGGNTYCERIEDINVHKYGAHIFHTSNKKVWDFVNSFVEFNRYINSPVANYKEKLYNLPFNMNTFYQMWGVATPAEAKQKIEEQRTEIQEKLAGGQPSNLEEKALSLVGRDIYETLIKGYTEKQWGRPCTELPSFIISRIPIRMVFDNNYFNDKYQGIPVGGYNKLISNLLEGVDVKLNYDFFDFNQKINKNTWRNYADKLVYTGPLDQYFNYKFGNLEYRTVYFDTKILDTPNYQGNAVVNYTDREIPFTRIIEHKHFESFGNEVDKNPKTIISKEFSTEWKIGMEPYYPVNDPPNNDLAAKYRSLVKEEKDVIFGGRLADYRYYDMAPVINLALNCLL